MARRSVIVSNPAYRGSTITAAPTYKEEYDGEVDVVGSPSHELLASPTVHVAGRSSKAGSHQFETSITQVLPPKRSRKGPAPKLFGSERCSICNSKATGFHYNVLSCEGCKNFFRRAIIKGLIYHCKTGKQVCPVDFDYRPRCQWCRLNKCMSMGMRSEYINRTKKQNQSLASKQLPERVQNLLANVRRSWEAATEGVEKPTFQSYLSGASQCSEDFDELQGIEKMRLDFFLEMAFFKTKRIIKFMNFLPGVHKLSRDMRIWLFKESLAESMVMFNSTTYNPSFDKKNGGKEPVVRWLDGEWRSKTDFFKCGLRQEMVEPMFDIWNRIDGLKIDKSVCAILMVLILLNPDRANIPEKIRKEVPQVYTIQEQYIEALQIYFEKKYRNKSGVYLGKTLDVLTRLRNISEMSLSIQLAQLQKMECQMPYLLARLFSYDNSIDIISTSKRSQH